MEETTKQGPPRRISKAERFEGVKRQFKYLGRTYTLRKRKPERDAVWYLVAEINGRRVSTSMKVNDGAVAEKKAIREIIHPLVTGQPIPEDSTVAQRLRPRGLATLGEVFNAFRAASQLRIKDRTMYDYIWSMREVVRTGTGKALKDLEIDGISTSVLERGLVTRFQQGMLRRSGKGELEQNSAAVSANSILAQARSLFGKRALNSEVYGGLKLPDLMGFMIAPKLPVLKQGNYEMPAVAVLNKLQVAAVALRVKDPQLWLAYYLAMQTGLRKGELMALRWGWFADEGVTVRFEEDFIPKGKRERFIPLGKETVQTIRETWVNVQRPTSNVELSDLGKAAMSQVRVLQGNVDLLFRNLGEWMKEHGWSRRMKAHELRKVFASVVTKVNSVYTAQAVLGHQDLKTTARYAATPVPVAVDVAKALGG